MDGEKGILRIVRINTDCKLLQRDGEQGPSHPVLHSRPGWTDSSSPQEPEWALSRVML